MPQPTIGQPIARKEARDKVTGKARYVDDLTFPGMLYGATVRSSCPRGRVRGIRFAGSLPWNEFTVVTAKDIPGKNCITLIHEDQPCLADTVVNHPEEPVVLLAHPDKYVLESIHLDKGNVEEAWTKADFVVEGEYHTGAQEQLYIEPNGMVAVANPEDGVTVWGSMQCPYYVHKALVPLFGLPKEKVRVVQTETGGGFGGKEEYPSMIAAHAALLAWKSGKPVKMIYDRAEDMMATTKRHPSRTRHRTAVAKDGRLLGMEIEFVIDGGAYCTLSPVVLSRGTIHAAGPYACPNVRIRSRAVATNAPPHGAFRGFGAPQSIFALERHMDKVAHACGLTPEEFRARNFIRSGGTLAVSQVIHENVDLPRLMERAFALSDYHAKRARFAKENL